MLIRVRFFAMLRERTGREDVQWQVESGETVGGLWEALCSEFPGLGGPNMPVAFAVNQEYVDRLRRLNDNDEVAIIPPVSGGVPHVLPELRSDRPHRRGRGGQ